jgi:hypothetical protein
MPGVAYYVSAEQRVSYRATLCVLDVFGMRLKPLGGHYRTASLGYILTPAFDETRADLGYTSDDARRAFAAFRTPLLDRNACVALIPWRVAPRVRTTLEAGGLRIVDSLATLLSVCTTFPPAIDQRRLDGLVESLVVGRAKRLLHDLATAPTSSVALSNAEALIKDACARGILDRHAIATASVQSVLRVLATQEKT